MQIQASSNRGMMPYGGDVEGLMGSRWTETADTAVRLVDLADRLGRTERLPVTVAATPPIAVGCTDAGRIRLFGVNLRDVR